MGVKNFPIENHTGYEQSVVPFSLFKINNTYFQPHSCGRFCICSAFNICNKFHYSVGTGWGLDWTVKSGL